MSQTFVKLVNPTCTFIHSIHSIILLPDKKGASQIIQPEERTLKENILVGGITFTDFIFSLLLQM